jgi:hypothetical protein
MRGSEAASRPCHEQRCLPSYAIWIAESIRLATVHGRVELSDTVRQQPVWITCRYYRRFLPAPAVIPHGCARSSMPERKE